MKEIELTKGKVALVDDDVFEYINQWSWYAYKRGNNWYAARRVREDGVQKIVLMHRAIMNAPQEKVVDHINHDGLDNRCENMRLCSTAENVRNSNPIKGGTSKYKGVKLFVSKYKNNRYYYWVAQIMVDKKGIHLGYFKKESEAAIAYNDAAKKYFGEFANLNIIYCEPCVFEFKRYGT